MHTHPYTSNIQVVFGIIVDTFSELRDEKQVVQDAMQSECFICSRKAYEFDRYGTPFVGHVKKEHYQWNYLYYMLYLANLDRTEYDSNEQYFADAVANEEEATVFPINKARCLAKMETGASDGAASRKVIMEQLTVVMAKLERLERAANDKANKARRQAGDADFDIDFDEPASASVSGPGDT